MPLHCGPIRPLPPLTQNRSVPNDASIFSRSNGGHSAAPLDVPVVGFDAIIRVPSGSLPTTATELTFVL
jgi:hypothetical protein